MASEADSDGVGLFFFGFLSLRQGVCRPCTSTGGHAVDHVIGFWVLDGFGLRAWRLGDWN